VVVQDSEITVFSKVNLDNVLTPGNTLYNLAEISN